MSEAHATPGEGGGSADWLGLAAAPTFAITALLTGLLGGGPSEALCSTTHGASPLSGMIPMYLLMSALHAAPWLRWIGRRAGRPRVPQPSTPAP